MILRPRQEQFKKRSVAALKKRRNTLGIAPTGAGKTVMLSAIAGGFSGARSLVLQHRDELVEQNERTYRKVNPNARTSFYTADYKRWGGDGAATFSMIQTLARDANLKQMPELDLVVIDEAHHAASDSYLKVLDHAARLNPKVMVFGVTATPARGDSRNLRATFDNVADQITIGELIAAGNLVKPRCFVIDTGTRDELGAVRKTPTDFDMTEVEAIMNKRPINEKILEKWREVAGDRQTVIFASKVQHAQDLADVFNDGGVPTVVIHGELPAGERKARLDDYDRGRYQVIVNVAVLTEGWDHQPTSCVVLARPCSFKSTMIQMIGRGLRTVDPERYPGVVKDDCIVLDFGYSLLTHKDIEQHQDIANDDGPKACPACSASVPSAVDECPICGWEWPRPEDSGDDEAEAAGSPPDKAEEALEDFVLTEVDLFKQSPFKWEDFFDRRVTVANAIDAWVACVLFRGRWVAVGGSRATGVMVVANHAERVLCLAHADDFLREHGSTDGARKSKRWLRLPPTDKQLQFLNLSPAAGMGINRYRASCAIQWTIMESAIKNKLMRQAPPKEIFA